MSTIRVVAAREIAAPTDRVYRILADYREHHPKILPPAFTEFTVEEGGTGAGTVIRFAVRAGGRTQRHHQRIDEPEPGRVLVEQEVGRDLRTTFTVTPAGSGSHVRIETAWSARGIQGLVERLVAPRLLAPIYADELERLDRYARAHPDL
jgi:hypothetical protein